jgi:hypothetical protein
MLDAGYWMLDTGCWMLDAGCWILDAGCWMFGFYRFMPETFVASCLRVKQQRYEDEQIF